METPKTSVDEIKSVPVPSLGDSVEKWTAFRDSVQLKNTLEIRKKWIALLPKIFKLNGEPQWNLFFNGTVVMIPDLFPLTNDETFVSVSRKLLKQYGPYTLKHGRPNPVDKGGEIGTFPDNKGVYIVRQGGIGAVMWVIVLDEELPENVQTILRAVGPKDNGRYEKILFTIAEKKRCMDSNDVEKTIDTRCN